MPYTVGYHDASATIAQGVGRGMQNLLGVLTDFADTKKREGAEADKLRGLLSIYEPDQKDSHKTIGLGELRSRAGAIAASQMKASEESKMAEALSQNRMRDTQRMGMEQSMAGNAALSSFSRDAMALNGAPPSAAALDANLGEFLQDPATIPPQPTSQEQAIQQALRMNPGAFMSPQFDNSLAALQKAMGGGQQMSPEMAFMEDPASGQRFVTRGNTMLPSGMNPEKAKRGIETITDDNGNEYPVTYDQKGNPKFVKAPGSGNFQLRPVVGADGKVIPGIGADSTGKIIDTRTGMEKMLGPQGAEAPKDEPGFFSRLFGGGGGKAATNAPAAAPVGRWIPGRGYVPAQ